LPTSDAYSLAPDHRRPPAPLVPAALGLAGGIWADAWRSVPAGACLVVFLAAGAVLVLLGRPQRRWAVRVLALASAAAAVGAMLHQNAYRRVPSHHIVRYTDRTPILVRVRGIVRTDPIIAPPDVDAFTCWAADKYRTRFLMEARSIRGTRGPIEVCGLVRVRIAEAALSLEAGCEIEALGWLYRIPPPANPGQFDYRKHQRRQGVLVGLGCSRTDAVRVRRRAADSPVRRAVQALRSSARALLLDGAAQADAQTGSLLQAMVLGQRSAVARSIDEAFVTTGTAHFLCVSGMHVGILCVFAWWLGRLLGLDRPAAAWGVLTLATVYLLVAELRAPILRAWVAAVLFCGAIILRRPFGSTNWIAAAGLVVLAIQPTQLFQASFQLSFGVLLAVVFLSPKLRDAFRRLVLRRTPELDRLLVLQDQRGPYRRLLGHAAHWGGWYLAVSVAAWMVGAPLAMVHFQRASVWGWANSVLMLPPALLVLLVGFAKVLAGAIWPSSAALLAPALTGLSKLLAGLAKTLAQVPLASVRCSAPPSLLVGGYLAVLALWVVRSRIGLARHWLVHGALAVLIGAAWWFAPSARPRAGLSLWVLAVGDGSATIVELPNGKCLLCDAGTLGGYDLGSATIVPALRHERVGQLDAAIISHPNSDHFSALMSVHRQLPIERVIVSDRFERLSPPRSLSRLLLERLGEHGVPVLLVRAGDKIRGTGQVRFEVLWPPAGPDPVPLDANESSLVLRISYEGYSILLPGDIEQNAQSALLAHADLRADVLILPHHGSVVRTTAAFVQAVNPQYVIRSSGQRNAWTSSGIAQLMAGRAYFNTADDGAIRITIERGRLSVSAFRTTRQGHPSAGKRRAEPLRDDRDDHGTGSNESG